MCLVCCLLRTIIPSSPNCANFSRQASITTEDVELAVWIASIHFECESIITNTIFPSTGPAKSMQVEVGPWSG